MQSFPDVWQGMSFRAKHASISSTINPVQVSLIQRNQAGQENKKKKEIKEKFRRIKCRRNNSKYVNYMKKKMSRKK